MLRMQLQIKINYNIRFISLIKKPFNIMQFKKIYLANY